MTQEEKAKAYDEALEKAKAHINSKGIGDTVDLCKHLFSELRESEDERIRKELIFFLKEEIPQCSIKEHADKLKEFVSYLEKQKEQKPAWSEEDEKMIDTIVSVLGQYIDYKAVSGTGTGYATPRYSKEIDWLKSLRPSWKPSEQDELMKLKYAGTSTKLD